MLCRLLSGRKALLVSLVLCVAASVPAQRLVDKNKGTHFETKKGFMDGNLVGTVYYNFGEIADWLNEPSRSGVWRRIMRTFMATAYRLPRTTQLEAV